jgi:hypothetical protein
MQISLNLRERFYTWRLNKAKKDLTELRKWYPTAREKAGDYGFFIDDTYWHNWELIRVRAVRILNALGSPEGEVPSFMA